MANKDLPTTKTDPVQQAMLRAVSHTLVHFHPGCFGPRHGFAWRKGDYVTNTENTALDALLRARLITTEPNGPIPAELHTHPRLVHITEQGCIRLQDWDHRVKAGA